MSAALIRSFGANRTVLRDINKEARLKGKRLPDKWQSLTVFMSVQPLRADEIVEESNERNAHGVKIYSFVELKTADMDAQFKADRVEYLGDTFEVTKVDKFVDNRMKLVHYRSHAFKINKARDK